MNKAQRESQPADAEIEVEAPSQPKSGRKAAGTPNPGTRRNSRKTGDERWLELLDVSARMFAKHGYAATSLQQIADELGILKGSIYYYINSKDDLLYEVIRTVYWQGVMNLQALSTAEGRAIDLLADAIEAQVVYLAEHLTATTVFLHEFDQLPANRREELSALDYPGLMRDLISRGRDDGSIRKNVDPNLAAMAILGASNWLYRWYREPGSKAPREIGREFAQIFVAGMAAK